MYGRYKEMNFIVPLMVLGVLAAPINPIHAACPVTTVSSVGSQVCFTGIGMLNSTIHSQDEICRMYRETLYCVQRQLHVEGLDCNLSDIASSMTIIYSTIGPSNFDYSPCKLTPETGSICTNEDRLSQHTLIACSPYLAQMQLYGDPSAACAYSTPLVQCAEQSLGYLKVQCSKFQIEETFKSQSASSFITRHAKGVDLNVCFKTMGVTDDKNCVDYITIFSYGSVLGCMTSISRVNLTDNMDPQDKKMQCSFVQEIMACMVKQLQGMGSHCTMAQMKSALNIYIHLSGMQSNLQRITECQDNDSYISLSMCNDEFRLASFLTTSGGSALTSLGQYSNKDLACSLLKVQAARLLKYVNVSCSSSEILSAVTYSFGTSFWNGHHPKPDISHCATGAVTEANSVKSHESREKRNAVAVKDWLWKDKKVPYVVDESGFDTVGALLIIKAIKQFNEDVTCIKFTPRVNEFDYVRFKSGQGCHSSIGRDGGEQTLTIGPDCYYLGVILHEMTHAVGFFHEQNRWDRDNYVTVFWNNIQTGKEHDFNLQDQQYLDTLGAPYDYGSIMHYGPYIFSKEPSKPTMTPKYDPHVEMGQRDGFSKLDIWKINTLYGCKSGTHPLPDWMTYLSSTWMPTSKFTTPATSVATSTSSVIPGTLGKPKVLVTVFANALRINWNQPISADQITGYLLSYKLEPNGRKHQVRVAANKLAYYLSTYITHPGRRFTITIAAITDKGVGPDSDPVTKRSACSKTIYLDNDTFDNIHSPFFKHGYYEQDVVCQWTIKTPPRQHINLTFMALNISGDNECSGDYVRIGSTRQYCNTIPGNGDIIMATNDVTVTFVSKPGPQGIKAGGFSMTASAQGYSPINLNIDEMVAGFNISWEPPFQTPSATVAYVISFKLTSEAVSKEIDVSPETRHFLLSTYPHFGREYSIEVYARYPTGNSQPTGPIILRSKCLRNITVSGSQEHLNSPHYPRKYEPGTICEWNVFPTSGRRLVLDFERTDLSSGDYVDILSEGTYLRIDAQNKPTGQIESDTAKVQFVSDGSGEAAGFRINFSLTSL